MKKSSKKSKVIYLTMCLKESCDVQVGNLKQSLKLDFAEGMVGVIPVFDTAKNARKYAGDKVQILAIEKT